MELCFHSPNTPSWCGRRQLCKKYSRTPLIRVANYPDRLGRSVKFVENSTKLTCFGIPRYRIKHGTVLWLLMLQIRLGVGFGTQVRTANSNSSTSDLQFSLFSKRNPIIRIYCISWWSAVPINPDNWSEAHNKRGPFLEFVFWPLRPIRLINTFTTTSPHFFVLYFAVKYKRE